MVAIDTLVLEVPQIYSQRKGRQSDLVELIGVVGAIGEAVDSAEAEVFEPRKWKGQVPKDVHNQRTLEKLSLEERSRIQKCADSVFHNILDGIGIGLYYLKMNSIRK